MVSFANASFAIRICLITISLILNSIDCLVMLSNDYANHAAAHRGAQFVQDTESDLMPPIPPTRTRGKMHDLAVKRCLITTGVSFLFANDVSYRAAFDN